MFFVYSLCAPCAAVPLNCDQMYPYTHRASFPEGCPLARQRWPHRVVHALDRHSGVHWMRSSVSAPCDRGLPLGDYFDEHTVLCICKCTLLLSTEKSCEARACLSWNEYRMEMPGWKTGRVNSIYLRSIHAKRAHTLRW
jgi:hypothetical protein